ncbi:MAG: 5-formyltetrahydrofolate cyclo-ligase [Gammaproteobacteria bacterium]
MHTPICDLLGCRYPVVLAGMGGVARSELVAAVTNAGGYGFLGMVREPPERIVSEIRAVREITWREFGINIIPAATDPELLDRQIDVCIEESVASVCLFWDVREDVIRRFRQAGILVIHQVGDCDDAMAAQDAGVHALIVQGNEAGGHVRATLPLREVLDRVLRVTRLPVLAAGGIIDGEDIARVFGYGAQGVVAGSAFLATEEAYAHDYHKQRILDSDRDETVLTDRFHINWPYGALTRVLPNSVTRDAGYEPGRTITEHTLIGTEDGKPVYLYSTDSPLKSTMGNLEAMPAYAGQNAYRINYLMSAGAKLKSMVEEAAGLFRGDGTFRYKDEEGFVSSSISAAGARKDIEPVDFTPDGGDWNSIRCWRKLQRERLISMRIGNSYNKKTGYTEPLATRLRRELDRCRPGTIGFYWPIKGEFDYRQLVSDYLEHGWQAALPVVVSPGEALEFRYWTPGMKLVHGIWNIPVPEERRVVIPDVLIVPLVGFDGGNYRLGYGGGYYDRTLAAFGNSPLTIGVGLEAFRLETIYPRDHDIPMDVIVTEAGSV